jgi:hypothetical protein
MVEPLTLAAFGAGVATVAYLVGRPIYRRVQKKKALNGEYGDHVQWGSELVDEGDQMFIAAVNELPNSELRDVGIIAESKGELREKTVERFDELADDNIPEDFME